MTVGSAMYEQGRKCWFCGEYCLSRLADKRIWCSSCRNKYNLLKLKRDLKVLYYFYLEVSARKCALEMHLSYKRVAKHYSQYRKALMDYTEKEFRKLRGLVEADESYFGGKRKGIVEEELSTSRLSLEFSREMVGYTLLLFRMFLQKHCLNTSKRRPRRVLCSTLMISGHTKI